MWNMYRDARQKSLVLRYSKSNNKMREICALIFEKEYFFPYAHTMIGTKTKPLFGCFNNFLSSFPLCPWWTHPRHGAWTDTFPPAWSPCLFVLFSPHTWSRIRGSPLHLDINSSELTPTIRWVQRDCYSQNAFMWPYCIMSKAPFMKIQTFPVPSSLRDRWEVNRRLRFLASARRSSKWCTCAPSTTEDDDDRRTEEYMVI